MIEVVSGGTPTMARIREIADVLPGISTGGRLEHDPTGTNQVVLSRHLVPGLPYRYEADHAFRINPGRSATRYEVMKGDVLFMSRGTRNVASWIEFVPGGSVATVSFYVLRPSSAVEPGFLAWFLNQPGAQRSIADVRTGAGTPIVQRAAFAELEIPMPDLSTQRTIARLGEAMVREQNTLERLAAASSRMHDLTSERLARDLIARAETNDDK